MVIRRKGKPPTASLATVYHFLRSLKAELQTLVKHGALVDPEIVLPDVIQMVESLEASLPEMEIVDNG